ncbi:MAG: DUF3293 domain-containing protein [Proteobacteria bacterium]|nr:DUF3293 domain-containing protein [Pseudomonadota bacterium]
MCIATLSSRTGGTRSDLSPRLHRAYRETAYACRGAEIRIGRRSRALDDLLLTLGARQGALLTAWNPRSRLLPEPVNRRRQRQLADRLRRQRTAEAEGRLKAWREEMLLVAGDIRPARRLGRLFRQNMLVSLRTGRKASLVAP